MQVDHIMTNVVVSVEMDDSLRVVKDIFDNTNFHHLLVVDNNELTGVISDRDLLKALSPNVGTLSETSRDAATLNKRSHQIMTRKPVTIKLGASIQEAISLFNKHTISCLPVVNTEVQAVGIVSWRDIFRTFQDTL